MYSVATLTKGLRWLSIFAVLCVMLTSCSLFEPDETHLFFIDLSGKPIAGPFDEALPFRENLAAARVGKLWGYVDTKGKWRIPPKYFNAESFSQGLAAVQNSKYERIDFIDSSGKIKFRTDFIRTSGFYEGLCSVQSSLDGRWGFIDLQGRLVIPHKFALSSYFSEGLAPVTLKMGDDARFGYINKKGDLVIPYTYRFAREFKDGIAIVDPHKLSAKKQKIDRQGKELPITAGCDYCPTQQADKWGYVNSTGQFIIPPKFKYAEEFTEGLAEAQDADSRRYGFIDHSGNWIVQPTHQFVGQFYDGRAVYGESTEEWNESTRSIEVACGYLDKDGRAITGMDFRAAHEYSNGFAIVEPTDYRQYLQKTKFSGF